MIIINTSGKIFDFIIFKPFSSTIQKVVFDLNLHGFLDLFFHPQSKIFPFRFISFVQ